MYYIYVIRQLYSVFAGIKGKKCVKNFMCAV